MFNRCSTNVQRVFNVRWILVKKRENIAEVSHGRKLETSTQARARGRKWLTKLEATSGPAEARCFHFCDQYAHAREAG